MNMNSKIKKEKLFGTDGIRGQANTHPITPQLALTIGQHLPQLLEKNFSPKHEQHKKILIARDTRNSGIMLQQALSSGLLSAGYDILVLGILPTPALACLTQKTDCAGGIMITASHNPYTDNGIKFFGPDGYKLNDAQEEEFQALLQSPSFHPAPPEKIGAVAAKKDSAETYLQSLPKPPLQNKTIVLDCGNGAASFIAPWLFESLGAKVITLNNTPNGKNINHHCGALYPEVAGEAVKKHHAHIGISFDGDADRVIFSDENGTPINGDRILYLLAIALQEEGKLANNTLVATTMSNLGLEQSLAEKNIALEITDVGDRHVLERLRQKKHSLGGENSGHIIFLDHSSTGDGILSALYVLSYMIKMGKPLSALVSQMTEYPQKLTNIPVSQKIPLENLPQFQQALQKHQSEIGDQGRILPRYSGTENKLRLLVEHPDAPIVEKITTSLTQILTKETGESPLEKH